MSCCKFSNGDNKRKNEGCNFRILVFNFLGVDVGILCSADSVLATWRVSLHMILHLF
jgi:hypothetical protein